MSDTLQMAGGRLSVTTRENNSCPPSLVPRHLAAFTLLELLVVISILGILAVLSVPALKNLGKSNVQVSAARQLLDDVGRARQLAISRRTTVYMVFVPTNFFNLNNYFGQNLVAGLNDPAKIPLAADRLAAMTALTNVIPLQLSGYNFLSLGKVGDQPGRHDWHYIDDWKSLPEGSIVPAQKFQPQSYSMNIPQWWTDYGTKIDTGWSAQAGNYKVDQISGFATYAVPFPTASSPLVYLPCLKFDFMGRLISEVDAAGSYHHAYLPLAQGAVAYGVDLKKQPQPTTVLPGDITENPAGNSTSISYNVIDINPLTGRAELQHFRMP